MNSELMLRKIKISDIAEKRLEEIDGASGCRGFFEIADAVIALSRENDRPFTLAYIDVDDFEKVNDTFGRDTGDALLKKVEALIICLIRESDTAVRLGKDEFVVLFVETDYAQAKASVRDLHRHLNDKTSDAGCTTTFSIGSVTYDGRQPKSVQEMITMAERLMYEAKRQGKNRISFAAFETIARLRDNTVEDKSLRRPTFDFQAVNAPPSPIQTQKNEVASIGNKENGGKHRPEQVDICGYED
jgi:diguanylate cyclase (GGDEF)-like protein